MRHVSCKCNSNYHLPAVLHSSGFKHFLLLAGAVEFTWLVLKCKTRHVIGAVCKSAPPPLLTETIGHFRGCVHCLTTALLDVTWCLRCA